MNTPASQCLASLTGPERARSRLLHGAVPAPAFSFGRGSANEPGHVQRRDCGSALKVSSVGVEPVGRHQARGRRRFLAPPVGGCPVQLVRQPVTPHLCPKCSGRDGIMLHVVASPPPLPLPPSYRRRAP